MNEVEVKFADPIFQVGAVVPQFMPYDCPKLRAETLLRVWSTASSPAAFICDDGHQYVVKGIQVGRTLYNDQLVARLGRLMQAPVGQPAIVEVPSGLIDATPALSHFTAGPAHGLRLIPDCSERIDNVDVASCHENRARFASLAVLFGWTAGSDVQFIYLNSDPKLVYSVDHGHFFPGGPPWTVDSLQNAPAAVPYAQIVDQCGLTEDEILVPIRALASVAEDVIASAVFDVPDEWQVRDDEKRAMWKYLIARGQAMCASATAKRKP